MSFHLFELRPSKAPSSLITMVQDPTRDFPDSEGKIHWSELEAVEGEGRPAFILIKFEFKLLGISGVRVSFIVLAFYLTPILT